MANYWGNSWGAAWGDSWGSVPAGALAGTVCWGHSTGVSEQNTRTFADHWTGTGALIDTGDSERVALWPGQYMEGEPVEISGAVEIATNQYAAADSVTVKYRTAATSAGLGGESWSTYSAPFASSGFIQVRLERPS